ncbi:MAG TPA: hypothetical protein VK444_07040 [Methanobacteriaceae archaeon]|nr:hypothetical protein [Methanobacteriaceae archaeon]
MNDNEIIQKSEIVLYTSDEGAEAVEVLFKDETIWLTQKTMGKLFDVNIPAISKHLKNIFLEEELYENSVVSILENTANEF